MSSATQQELSVKKSNGLVIDLGAREVTLDGRVLSLTKTEFDLLVALSQRPRTVVRFDQLMSVIGAGDWYSDTHAVKVHMSRLRRKLGETGKLPRFIHTIRGVGYRFEYLHDAFLADNQSIHSFVLLYDHEFILRSVDPAGELLLGWDPVSLVGTPYWLAPGTENREEITNFPHLVKLCAESGITTLESTFPTLNRWGYAVEVHVSHVLTIDHFGRFNGMKSNVTV